MGGIGERAYLGATLERVDELLGEADGSFAGGVLVTVQAENSIASERVCCQNLAGRGVALRIGVEELGKHTFAKREMAPATQVLMVNFPL